MEELETGVEQIQEEVHHEALHGGVPKWFTMGAVLSAMFAVLAAVSALFSGHHANEAMIDQMKAADQWAFFQAKSIKATIVESNLTLLKELGKNPNAALIEKSARYREEQKVVEKDATEKEEASHHHFEIHSILAKGVTFFQIAIGIVAIAVLARKRKFLYLAGAFGAAGAFFLTKGLFFS